MIARSVQSIEPILRREARGIQKGHGVRHCEFEGEEDEGRLLDGAARSVRAILLNRSREESGGSDYFAGFAIRPSLTIGTIGMESMREEKATSASSPRALRRS
ncbi:MAG: hypothetical protein FJY73_02250, partial [Candidatus Eisenbacteria bacterium]|nr:hypothetical protein [Candidatus Eisenbacteria bacterium]